MNILRSRDSPRSLASWAVARSLRISGAERPSEGRKGVLSGLKTKVDGAGWGSVDGECTGHGEKVGAQVGAEELRATISRSSAAISSQKWSRSRSESCEGEEGVRSSFQRSCTRPCSAHVVAKRVLELRSQLEESQEDSRSDKSCQDGQVALWEERGSARRSSAGRGRSPPKPSKFGKEGKRGRRRWWLEGAASTPTEAA